MWFFKRDKTNWENLGIVADPRPDEEKKKDFRAEEIFSAAPFDWKVKAETEWRKFPAFNQDGSSSCAAQSIAKALGIENHIEENKFVHYSARDIYTRRKNAPDKGMYFLDAMKIGHDYGATFEQLMPSQDLNETAMNVTEDRTPLTEIAGKIGRGGNYVRFIFPKDLDALAQAIEGKGKGVVLGVSFGSGEWGKYVPEIKTGYTPYGHAIVATNATLHNGKKAFVIEDSAGVSTSKDGRRILTEDWFNRGRVIFAGYYTFLKNDGTETKPHYVFNNNLYYGMTDHPEVKKLQECLAYLKYFPSDVDWTGNFFGITLKAVKDFQTAYGIKPVYGYCGPLTRAKLNEIFS